ncbi:MAG: shikimate kinase [Candidatus Omnitrophota bacterium]
MANIYLVGFMGTGKTSVGCELARKKKWQFLDLDDLIELREKRTVADIFSKSGEPYFRRLEKEILKEASKENNFVVACGGGIVINHDNIKIMKETGTIICLVASADRILKRTSGYAHRPLLNVKDPKKQIEHLLKLRSTYYAKADKTIDTSKLSVTQVAEKIVKVTTSPSHKVTSRKVKAQGKRRKSRNSGFIALLGLLLTAAIICIMAYIALNYYFKRPALPENIDNSLSMSGQGINTSTYKSVIDTTKKKVQEIEKQEREHAQQLEGL